jgi:hypothetical protein
VTTFVIATADARNCQLQADEVRVTDTGALVLSRAGSPLVPVAVFAARSWLHCLAEGVPVLWLGEGRAAAKPEKHQPTPRFA